MNVPEVLTLISALTGAIVTIIGAIKSHQRGKRAHGALTTLDGKVNGRLEQLLDTTREAARLAGYADGLRDWVRLDSGEFQRPKWP